MWMCASGGGGLWPLGFWWLGVAASERGRSFLPWQGSSLRVQLIAAQGPAWCWRGGAGGQHLTESGGLFLALALGCVALASCAFIPSPHVPECCTASSVLLPGEEVSVPVPWVRSLPWQEPVGPISTSERTETVGASLNPAKTESCAGQSCHLPVDAGGCGAPEEIRHPAVMRLICLKPRGGWQDWYLSCIPGCTRMGSS